MDADTFITFAVIILFCALAVLIANWVEKRWHRMHPPDDGTREVKFDDENTGS